MVTCTTRKELLGMERELERQQRAKKREEIENTLEMVTLVVVVGLFAGGLLFGSHWAIYLAGCLSAPSLPTG